jgi:hypothetical protein
MKALLHVHSDFSYDGKNSLEELARWGAQRGLDALLLSEHVNDFDDDKMRRLVERCDGLNGSGGAILVPGLEFAVEGGFHILGFALRRFRATVKPAEAVRFIRDEGGLAVLAHPARYRGAWPAPEVLALLDGIEVWNATYDGRFFPSGKILRACGERLGRVTNARPFGGQDLHTVTRNRLVATEARDARSVPELIDALRAGSTRFGAAGFRFGMAGRPRGPKVALASVCHAVYRTAKRTRDRLMARRPTSALRGR